MKVSTLEIPSNCQVQWGPAGFVFKPRGYRLSTVLTSHGDRGWRSMPLQNRYFRQRTAVDTSLTFRNLASYI